MRFSQSVAKRYGLNSENVSSLQDFEKKMDRTITGLEYEIYLKQAECNKLIDKIKMKEEVSNAVLPSYLT